VRALPGFFTHKKGTERFDVEGGLLGFPHVLYDAGKRIKFRADEADDEVVVAFIQAVAGQADVVGKVSPAVSAPDGCVFHQDLALFFVVQAGEFTVAPEGVPDGPGPVGIEDVAAGAAQEGVFQVGLVTGGIGPAQHGQFRAAAKRGKRFAGQECAHFVYELIGKFGHKQDADPAGVVHIAVKGRFQAAPFQGIGDGSRVDTPGEDLELHVEPPVAGLGLAVFGRAFFPDVQGFGMVCGMMHRGPPFIFGLGF
jgi:hypothetical protein